VIAVIACAVSVILCLGIGALQDIANQQTVSLWKLDAKLRIKVNVATYVNVRDKGEVIIYDI